MNHFRNDLWLTETVHSVCLFVCLLVCLCRLTGLGQKGLGIDCCIVEFIIAFFFKEPTPLNHFRNDLWLAETVHSVCLFVCVVQVFHFAQRKYVVMELFLISGN